MIPNNQGVIYTARFYVSVTDVINEDSSKAIDYTNYLNIPDKGVGKWKIKKRIVGGADADKFVIREESLEARADYQEGYLDFITPPDF